MSDDIVARLRLWAEGVEKQKAIVLSVAITEAADEIERLREELRKAQARISVLSLEAIARIDEEMANGR